MNVTLSNDSMSRAYAAVLLLLDWLHSGIVDLLEMALTYIGENVTVDTLATIILIGCTTMLLLPKTRNALTTLPIIIIRRAHHLGAVLLPDLFLRNPTVGPRWVPTYLLADGLTAHHTTIPAHKGDYTFDQLTNHHVPNLPYKISLVPTIGEASAGLHPSCGIRVSVPARSRAVETIRNDSQNAIDNGTSEASSTLNLIQAISTRLNHPMVPNLCPINIPPGGNLADVMFTHPGPKEVCIALHIVLALDDNKKKLGALYPLCQDQHVIIAQADAQRRINRRRRLNAVHGAAPVDREWISVPF